MSSSNSLRPADSDSDQIVSTPQGDVALLTLRPLKVEEVLASVGDKGVGGTAVFVGTTRDHFNGKRVVRLEYEAFVPLALKTLRSILVESRTVFPSAPPPSTSTSPSSAGVPTGGFHRLAIHHLLGPCPPLTASIVVAASSTHRGEAFRVCEWAVDQVKKRVEVWKKEVYEGGTGAEGGGEWKENYPGTRQA